MSHTPFFSKNFFREERERYLATNCVILSEDDIFLRNLQCILLFEFLEASNNKELNYKTIRSTNTKYNPLLFAVLCKNISLVRYLLAKGYSPDAIDSYRLRRPIDDAYEACHNYLGDPQIGFRMCSLMASSNSKKIGNMSDETIVEELWTLVMSFLSHHYQDISFEKIAFNKKIYDCGWRNLKQICSLPYQTVLQIPSLPIREYLASKEYIEKEKQGNLPPFLIVSITRKDERTYHVEADIGVPNDSNYTVFFDNDFVYQYGYWILVGTHFVQTKEIIQEMEYYFGPWDDSIEGNDYGEPEDGVLYEPLPGTDPSIIEYLQQE